MKCEFCGANIDIESSVCPHCGMQKKQFEQHRRDMGQFTKQFEVVRDDVVAENRRFSQKASFITVLCLLVILNLALIIMHATNWRIYKHFLVKDINKHATQYAATLSRMEDNEEFEEIAYFYEEKSLFYADDKGPLKEYNLLRRFCSTYNTFMLYIPNVTIEDYTDDTYSKKQFEQNVEYVVDSYHDIHNMYDMYVATDEYKGYYSEEMLSEKHVASFEAMMDNMDYLLMSYCGFDEAQMDEFCSASKAERCIMIQKAYGKELE